MTEEKLTKEQKIFIDRLKENCKNGWLHCEICNLKIPINAMSVFVYPDLTIKGMCIKCIQSEYLKHDYGNKN